MAQALHRPVLELSGPRLSQAFEALVDGAEKAGGIEALVCAVGAKAALFRAALVDEDPGRLDETGFTALCAFIAPVRRRIGAWLGANGYAAMQGGILALLDGAADTTTADARTAAFQARFPDDRLHRWVRDLAAELLHGAHPELYPLATRWVWDARANTGVLREIWYATDEEPAEIDVPDGHETFLVLREELSAFLTANGVFRDMPAYVDLLCAQIYAGYVATQGGSFLRAEFNEPDDPLAYTRRMLGLDGMDFATGRLRVKPALRAMAG